jgi:hypothetical protein
MRVGRLVPVALLLAGLLTASPLASPRPMPLGTASGTSKATKSSSRIYFSAAYVYGDSVRGYGPDRQIYSIEPSGFAPAQLTFDALPSSAPLPSPDGRLVAFSRGGGAVGHAPEWPGAEASR